MACAMRHDIKHLINFAVFYSGFLFWKCFFWIYNIKRKSMPFVWNNNVRIGDFKTKDVSTSANRFSDEINRQIIFQKTIAIEIIPSATFKMLSYASNTWIFPFPQYLNNNNNTQFNDIFFSEYSILSKNIKLYCCLFVLVTNRKLLANIGAFVHIAILT